MQVEYQYYFRPAQHWNLVSAEVYHTLLKFYLHDTPLRLKLSVKEKE